MATLPYSPTPLRSATSIRVISCAESGVNNTLHFKTTQIDLEDPDRPPYRCLSYTWGNPLPATGVSEPEASVQWNQEHPVFLFESDTTDDVRLFTVTTNLFHFLQQFCILALPGTPWIWIDAMCINQLDQQERGVQVDMMGRIYTSCAEVIIWLGIGTPETQRVFETMSLFVSTPQDAWDELFPDRWINLLTSEDEISEFTKRLIRQGLPGPGELLQKAFIHLLRRSWFHRIWTVQEHLLPPRGQIWCGSDHMKDLIRLPRLGDLAYFYTFTTFRNPNVFNGLSDQEKLALPTLIYFLQNHIEEFKTEGHTQTRLRSPSVCISRFREKQCSDPRDYIYGTLGLQDTPLLRADYKLSVQELFTQVTLHPAMSYFLLGDCEDESVRTTPDLPSWVSDWSSPMLPKPWHRGYNGYRVGVGDNEGIVCEPISGGGLEVEGFEEDEIAVLGGNYVQTHDGEGLLESLTVLKLAHTKLETLRSKPNLVECFWRTLIANLRDSGPQHPCSEVHGVSFRNFTLTTLSKHLCLLSSSDHAWVSTRATLDYLHLHDPGAHLPLWGDIVGTINDDTACSEVLNGMGEYIRSLALNFRWRRFFITIKGRMGIAPQGAQVKDVVVIVKRGKYPLLMRRGSSGRFRFLGQAYVDGIMYGEALQEISFGKIEIEQSTQHF